MDATFSRNSSDITMLMQELIKRNYVKLQRNIPVNPSISKDDEWADEDEWDEYGDDINNGSVGSLDS